MSDPARSVPPPSAAPPAAPATAPAEASQHAEVELALDAPRGAAGAVHRLRLDARRVEIEHGRVLRAPLRLALGLVKIAAIDPGAASVSGAAGRFPILHRLGPTTVIPRQEGIEGWLWTSTGGTALTNLDGDDEAPNVALVFTKPLDDALLQGAFDPAFVSSLAARSPLGKPVVTGVVLRVKDASAARNAFRRWGFQDIVTDRDIAPVQRRHLATDRPADPMVQGQAMDAARARTSVPPPGF